MVRIEAASRMVRRRSPGWRSKIPRLGLTGNDRVHVSGRRRSLCGPDREVAHGYHATVDEIDQKAPPAPHPTVVGEQVPDVEGPVGMAGLAGRRPGDRLEVPQVAGTSGGLRGDPGELAGGAGDLHRRGAGLL